MINKKQLMIENLFIFIGTVFLNVGFYFFFTPNNIVTGGVTGMSIILNNYGIPLSLTILILNVAFLTVGFLVLGVKYGLRSIFASLLGPVIIFVLEQTVRADFFVDLLTESPLLMSTLVGALLTGFGLGIVFRNGGSTGGIDILQNILNKKFHIDYRTVFFMTDGVIVLIGLFVFKDVQAFLYAIGAVYLFSMIIDSVSVAGKSGNTLFIVSRKHEEINEILQLKLDRGTTIVDAKGGYSDEEKKLIICVVNKRQLNYARHLVGEVDPNAFTFIAQTKEVVGLGFTRHKE